MYSMVLKLQVNNSQYVIVHFELVALGSERVPVPTPSFEGTCKRNIIIL